VDAGGEVLGQDARADAAAGWASRSGRSRASAGGRGERSLKYVHVI